jgi:hypothetical protein
MKIKCSKFDDFPPPPVKKNTGSCKYIPQIYSEKTKAYIPISTNGREIYHNDEKINLEEFRNRVRSKPCKIFVLTDKEKKLLYKWSIRNKIPIHSFEECYPFFKGIKYINNLEKSCKLLINLIKKLKTYGLKNSTTNTTFNISQLSKIKNKIHKKSTLDSSFFKTIKQPYQEVFIFNELRNERLVLALDFNSMYSSCMKGEFLDPATLKHSYRNEKYFGTPVEPGLYKVILKGPKNTFFKKFHPFRISKYNGSLNFELKADNEIITELFWFELEYYSKFFHYAELLEAITSEKCIGHPLYQECNRLYQLRIKAKNKNNKTLESIYKYRLASLHSLTNPFNTTNIEFSSKNELESYLFENFGITNRYFQGNALPDNFRSKYINYNYNGNTYSYKGIDIKSQSCIFSLTAQVIAQSRVKITKQIEELLKFDDLIVCYANTDSIHISIPESSRQLFIEKFGHAINNEIGCLKIQSEGNSGVWFDVGRYFIFQKNQVVQHKNIMINHKGSENPFLTHRLCFKRFKSGIFDHTVSKIITVQSSFSYKKKLNLSKSLEQQLISYERFSYDEIQDTDSSAFCEFREVMSSSDFKINFYSKLKAIYKW